jgi:hypothetical protein
MEYETGMIWRGFWQHEPRQRGASALIFLDGAKALKGWAVIQPMPRSEGNDFRPWNLSGIGKVKVRRIRQARQCRKACAGAKRKVFVSKAWAHLQRKAAFPIRRTTQLNLAIALQRHGAEDRKVLNLQHRRFRM